MKRLVTLSASVLLVMLFVGSASATHFSAFTPTADCEGWSVSGTLYYGASICGDVDYTVQLIQGTTVVEEITGTIVVCSPDLDFTIGTPWTVELCGDYVAKGTVTATNIRGTSTKTFEKLFNCPCDEPDGCTGTPGYWKNHPEAWLGVSLTLGGLPYTQAQCLDLFAIEPSKRDGTASAKLVHHLMAAKLNYLSGVAHLVDAEIAAADAWIAANCMVCNPSKDAKTEMVQLIDALDAYNNMNTTCDPFINGPIAPIIPSFSRTSQPQETRSWGEIKMIYK